MLQCTGQSDRDQRKSTSAWEGLEAYVAVCARLSELGRGDRAMLQQQVTDAHVAHIVVLRLQRKVFEEASDLTQPACRLSC